MTESNDRRLTSAEVADKMQVKVGWVYKLRVEARHRETGFPNPVAFNGRSPLFSEAAIDAYIAGRAEREPSSRGRPPRTEIGAPDETFAGRLRRAIAAGEGRPDVPTQAALIALLDLNVVTFGERMRGRTRWTTAELTRIHELVGVDVDDANDVVDATRASRAGGKGSSSDR